MISATLFLAVWLTPVLWLEMPALILERGPDGVWIGLALMLAALIALGARPAEAGLRSIRHRRIIAKPRASPSAP